MQGQIERVWTDRLHIPCDTGPHLYRHMWCVWHARMPLSVVWGAPHEYTLLALHMHRLTTLRRQVLRAVLCALQGSGGLCVQACCNGLLPPSAPRARASLSICGIWEQHSVMHVRASTQAWRVWLLVPMGRVTGSKLVACSSHEELHLEGLILWAPPVVCVSQYVPRQLTSAAKGEKQGCSDI